jgi:hypothetical protein
MRSGLQKENSRLRKQFSDPNSEVVALRARVKLHEQISRADHLAAGDSLLELAKLKDENRRLRASVASNCGRLLPSKGCRAPPPRIAGTAPQALKLKHTESTSWGRQWLGTTLASKPKTPQCGTDAAPRAPAVVPAPNELERKHAELEQLLQFPGSDDLVDGKEDDEWRADPLADLLAETEMKTEQAEDRGVAPEVFAAVQAELVVAQTSCQDLLASLNQMTGGMASAQLDAVCLQASLGSDLAQVQRSYRALRASLVSREEECRQVVHQRDDALYDLTKANNQLTQSERKVESLHRNNQMTEATYRGLEFLCKKTISDVPAVKKQVEDAVAVERNRGSAETALIERRLGLVASQLGKTTKSFPTLSCLAR